MRKWISGRRTVVIAVMTLAVLGTAGCQKQYEKIDLSGTSAAAAQAEVSPVDAALTAATQSVETEGPGAATTASAAEDAAAEGAAAEGQTTGTAAAETTAATLAEELTLPALEERDETVYVNATDLNVRWAPRSDAEVVTVLNMGGELKRTGYSEDWSRVTYQGETCYAASRYLTTEKPAIPETCVDDPVNEKGEVGLNSSWKYAEYSKINSGRAILYRSSAANRRGKVVCVNAGHGTSGGGSVKTQCHPDGTPKVTGGTTGAGATTAVAVSGGMTFSDGTPEAKVTLAMAKVLKEKLLARGYDVLMIRESDDVQLDNVARTVLANNLADCHIAIHWDSTTSNKGAFYMSVPNVASYRSMEPVASHWQQHNALGESLIGGLKTAGVKIFSGGSMEMDLTQTSYSTVPSVDIELGDKVSDHSASTLDKLGTGLADGVEAFFGN